MDTVYAVMRNTYIGRGYAYYAAAVCPNIDMATRVKDFLNRQLSERPDGEEYGDSAAHSRYSFGTNGHDYGDFDIVEIPLFNEADIAKFFNNNFLHVKDQEKRMIEGVKKYRERMKEEEEEARRMKEVAIHHAEDALKAAEVDARHHLDDIQENSIDDTLKKVALESRENLEDIKD